MPNYIDLHKKGVLKKRKDQLYELLNPCRLCPRECKVNRKEKSGYCDGEFLAKVSSYGPHFGEEPELVGLHGSGTIFFSGCNLKCDYCQNYDISIVGYGNEVEARKLADMMVSLKRMGCHNINFVTPTHFAPQIVDALISAVEKGLDIPLVYNCGGYESVETLKLLDGIIDIYMPDIKYGDSAKGAKYSHVDDYFEVVKEAVKEMHRQVGDLVIEHRVAQKGLIIRHLVLPSDEASSEKVMDFIVDEVSKDSYVNIMDQYKPTYKADSYPSINRHTSRREYAEVTQYANGKGLYRGFTPLVML
jgi:putative pyruvate formate lyase activating enzyme